MTAVASDAEQLFAEAVARVRATASGLPERAPAFELPRPPRPRASGPAPADVPGLPGDLWDTAEALRRGDTTVEVVLDRAAARLRDHAAALGAFEFVADVAAERDRLAAAASRGEWAGPLHGIPVSVKDIIDVAGMPTTGSSRALPPRRAAADAEAVARLRRAGAVIVGKAVTHEFALGVTTEQSHNPWNPDRVPGGSSGGSVISVVTGMAFASLGTDTRASIRVPPALSGGVGFKPSRGVIPVDRWCTLSWTMDHFGPITRSVRDAALVLDVLAAEGAGEPPPVFRSALPGALAGRRIGVARAFLDGAEPGVAARFTEALARCAEAGADVVELSTLDREMLDLANQAGLVLSRAEAARYHEAAGTVIDDCSAEVRDQLRGAGALLAADYLHAQQIRGVVQDHVLHAMAEVDVLAMPTAKVTAPRRDEAGRYLLRLSENCIPWSFIDCCAVSVFSGMSDGLPTGLQLVGPPGADRLLIAVAHAVEQATEPLPAWTPR